MKVNLIQVNLVLADRHRPATLQHISLASNTKLQLLTIPANHRLTLPIHHSPTPTNNKPTPLPTNNKPTFLPTNPMLSRAMSTRA